MFRSTIQTILYSISRHQISDASPSLFSLNSLLYSASLTPLINRTFTALFHTYTSLHTKEHRRIYPPRFRYSEHLSIFLKSTSTIQTIFYNMSRHRLSTHPLSTFSLLSAPLTSPALSCTALLSLYITSYEGISEVRPSSISLLRPYFPPIKI